MCCSRFFNLRYVNISLGELLLYRYTLLKVLKVQFKDKLSEQVERFFFVSTLRLLLVLLPTLTLLEMVKTYWWSQLGTSCFTLKLTAGKKQHFVIEIRNIVVKIPCFTLYTIFHWSKLRVFPHRLPLECLSFHVI